MTAAERQCPDCPDCPGVDGDLADMCVSCRTQVDRDAAADRAEDEKEIRR